MQFSHPFTCLVSGPTKSGKTTWTMKFVENAHTLVHPKPDQIIWCYQEWQPSYEKLLHMPNVQLIEGMPDLQVLNSSAETAKLLILDDFMHKFGKGEDELASLFTRGCHHWNVSCIHLVQNFFHGKRTARVNVHYIVLMRNPSDKLQVHNLARQVCPGQHKHFIESYNDATQYKYGYLLIILSPELEDERLCLHTCIFPEEIQSVYLPK